MLERAYLEDREWRRQADRRMATLIRMIMANQRELKGLREEARLDRAELKEQRAVLTSIARALNRHIEGGER